MGPDPALLVAGVDEAGRGPLAGPVVAAAVILDPQRRVDGLADSKTLSPARREQLALLVRERALAWSVGQAGVEEIDALNILQATLLAMRRALQQLSLKPALVLVDGNRCPETDGTILDCEFRAEVRGDERIEVISAASILAKTVRDQWMCRAAEEFPGYGFEAHKGYGTAGHLQALERLGPCRLHRRSFAPLKSRNPDRNPAPKR